MADWRTLQDLERSLGRASDLARYADALDHLDPATRYVLEEGRRAREFAERSLVDEAAASVRRTLQPYGATQSLAEIRAASIAADLAAAGYRDPHNEFLELLSPAKDLQRFYEAQFRLPDLWEADRLLVESLTARALTQAVFGAEPAAAQLRGVFESLQTPWLHEQHFLASAAAMAELQAIGALAAATPFDHQLGEALRHSLGDWRDPISFAEASILDVVGRTALYLDHGFDRSLTDFPAPAFHEGLRRAGLQEETDTEEDEAGEEDGLARAGAAFRELQVFEVAMRRFIRVSLEGAAGSAWMRRRVPAQIYDRWREKQEKGRKNGEPERPLIDYADFTDYLPIIDRNDNWTEVFALVFGRKEDIRESLQRLFPVRLCTMHARPITQDDELLLASETRRVLKAIAKLT